MNLILNIAIIIGDICNSEGGHPCKMPICLGKMVLEETEENVGHISPFRL